MHGELACTTIALKNLNLIEKAGGMRAGKLMYRQPPVGPHTPICILFQQKSDKLQKSLSDRQINRRVARIMQT